MSTYDDADIQRLGLLDPTSEPATPGVKTSLPRLQSLVGKRVGLFDNSKTNVATLLARIGRALVRDYGAAELIVQTKHIYSRVAPAALIEDLARRCDAVVTAIGD